MRNKPLTEEQRNGVRAMHQADKRTPYRVIARKFDVSVSCIANIINEGYHSPKLKDPVRIALPPKTPVSDFIRPIPLARLMAGR